MSQFLSSITLIEGDVQGGTFKLIEVTDLPAVVPTGSSSTLTAGSVLFVGPAGVYAQDNANLFWDDAKNRLGLGTAAPGARLHLKGEAAAAGTGTVSSSSATVTGSGTAFTSEVAAGDVITAAGQVNLVSAVTNDTSLTTVLSFNPALPAGTSFTVTKSRLRADDSSGGTATFLDGLGRLHLNCAAPTTSNLIDVGRSTTYDLGTNPTNVGINAISTLPGFYATGAAFGGTCAGYNSSVAVAGANTQNWTGANGIVGMFGQPTINSGATGTITMMSGVQSQGSNFGSGTLTSYFAFRESADAGGSGTVTNSVGLGLVNHTRGGTSNVNLLVGTTSVPSGNWSVYSASTYDNYFGGNTRFVQPAGSSANRTEWYDSDGTTLRANVTPGGWLQNKPGRARNTADVTNVTTTFANLGDLSLTLVAGRKYTGRIVLAINDATAADGFKFDLNGGSATMTSIEFGVSAALAATVGVRTSTALATALTLTALGDTSDVFVEIPVTLVCNAAGTLIPRQAKNSDAAGATLTVRAGSYFWLEDSPN